MKRHTPKRKGKKQPFGSFAFKRKAVSFSQDEEAHPELENKVTVIFPPWGEQKVTLGVWSRFAIASGTKNQAEAKVFLQWLVSDDRLLRYDSVLSGHMIPPLNSVREATLANPFAYT